jgi:outer membrane protein OmpA-like peptidoglycan-associated protein
VMTRVAPTAPAATSAPQPAMPEAEPQTASINPIAPPEPPAGTAPPPPPPVSATAATKAAPTTAGLRLTFAPDQSDLSPDSSASIKQLATSAQAGDDTTYNVQAYAPGKPDDPSTARRVSLSRAMAVRAALVASGVPSARIFVRALGEQFGDGPPDRVDIAVNGTSGTASAQ